MRTMYELRLNGTVVEISTNLDYLTNVYETKKNANPNGYYEIYKVLW